MFTNVVNFQGILSMLSRCIVRFMFYYYMKVVLTPIIQLGSIMELRICKPGCLNVIVHYFVQNFPGLYLAYASSPSSMEEYPVSESRMLKDWKDQEIFCICHLMLISSIDSQMIRLIPSVEIPAYVEQGWHGYLKMRVVMIEVLDGLIVINVKRNVWYN